MNKYTNIRTINRLLPEKFVARVLRKFDEYPFKNHGVVPYSIANPIVARTFRVDKYGCHQIYFDLEQAGWVKIHALRGVEVLQEGREAYQEAEAMERRQNRTKSRSKQRKLTRRR